MMQLFESGAWMPLSFILIVLSALLFLNRLMTKKKEPDRHPTIVHYVLGLGNEAVQEFAEYCNRFGSMCDFKQYKVIRYSHQFRGATKDNAVLFVASSCMNCRDWGDILGFAKRNGIKTVSCQGTDFFGNRERHFEAMNRRREHICPIDSDTAFGDQDDYDDDWRDNDNSITSRTEPSVVSHTPTPEVSVDVVSDMAVGTNGSAD